MKTKLNKIKISYYFIFSDKRTQSLSVPCQPTGLNVRFADFLKRAVKWNESIRYNFLKNPRQTHNFTTLYVLGVFRLDFKKSYIIRL